jgi:hypothetical protein
MQLLQFVLLLLVAVHAQPPPCDPFYEVCPNAECDSAGQAGQILFRSPTDASFFFLNSPINITIDFTPLTNRQYSQN